MEFVIYHLIFLTLQATAQGLQKNELFYKNFKIYTNLNNLMLKINVTFKFIFKKHAK